MSSDIDAILPKKSKGKGEEYEQQIARTNVHFYLFAEQQCFLYFIEPICNAWPVQLVRTLNNFNINNNNL